MNCGDHVLVTETILLQPTYQWVGTIDKIYGNNALMTIKTINGLKVNVSKYGCQIISKEEYFKLALKSTICVVSAIEA